MTWVLLPGMDGTGELFAPFLAQALRENVCVVARYPEGKVLTRAELLKLIYEVLPSFEDYILVAESFSGQFAIEIVASKPVRLSGLVLANSFATSPVRVVTRFAL